ncbi:MAG: hypothetical protein EOM52_07450 [Clostridia bacterium]|nr:hypothetical protein [Clostridia bacterium]
MILFKLMERLEAAEQSIAQLKAQVERIPAPFAGGGEQEKPPVFKLDDAKLQEGIANLMGYDPFSQKRSDV